ncbi:MAG: hypothetical protein AAF346_01290 [Pseudomonadota bacterium]
MASVILSKSRAGSILAVLVVLAGSQAASHTSILIATVGFMMMSLPNCRYDEASSCPIRLSGLAQMALRGPAAMALIKSMAYYALGFAIMLTFSYG